MTSQESLEAFIATSFRSVWALEILRFLADNRDRAFSGTDLIVDLHLSQAVVRKCIKDLSDAGLIAIDANGAIALAAKARTDLVLAAIDYYAKSPNKVRRLIVAKPDRP